MNSSLKNCGSCSTGQQETDCASCKIAELREAAKKAKKTKKAKESPSKNSAPAIDEEGDYSLSEQLTEKGNDLSILYLVIAAAFILLLVVLFSKLLT